jgi:hypothetical protein
MVELTGLMNLDGTPAVRLENPIQVSMLATLLNIEQERLNLNAAPGRTALVNPPINLNLYVLFSALAADYTEALKAVSFTLGYFQGKQVFTPANTPGLPEGAHKITAEMVNVEMKDLSNFWTALGAKQLPSVLFRLRMLSITSDMIIEEFTEVRAIDSRARSKPD